MEMVGKRLGGARVFEIWCYCNVLYTIGTGSMRRFQWYSSLCDSSKPHRATPKHGNGGEKVGWGAGFEFWCYCNVLYTIGTGSMRRLQWPRALRGSLQNH